MESGLRQHDGVNRFAPSEFRQGVGRRVRFRAMDPVTWESNIIVRERARTVSIIQHDGERQNRPMVRIARCIAGRVICTEVSPIDRSEFAFPLLQGHRSPPFALIEPASAILSEPDCAAKHHGRSANR